MKKRKVKKSFFKSSLFLFFLVSAVYFGVYFGKETGNSINRIPIVDKIVKKNKDEKKYNECLTKTFLADEINDQLRLKINEIDSLIKTNSYNVSVYYEDLKTGFNYQYLADKVYYGCSLIKLVDALYLIDKATIGEIDLDGVTIEYESKYKMSYSMGLASKKIGDKISLRDLITYAITYSDNSAHLMLLDFIGFNNLKRYGQNLGAQVILTGGDNFGFQTAIDTNIYLKKAYQIIMENEEYGEFLKSIMDNNERNDFNTEGIKIYHKYGSYENNYHDIGLSLDDKPYTISIFTLHEYSNHQEVVQTIHEKVRELRDLFYEIRENNCKLEVYGE